MTNEAACLGVCILWLVPTIAIGVLIYFGYQTPLNPHDFENGDIDS